jgi:hypothetical protein
MLAAWVNWPQVFTLRMFELELMTRGMNIIPPDTHVNDSLRKSLPSAVPVSICLSLAVARQRLGKNVNAAIDTDLKVEELQNPSFSLRFSSNQESRRFILPEAGKNTSTAALRVRRGDKEGPQSRMR